jgi:elongation factor P--(R)-beta-lysine ligase
MIRSFHGRLISLSPPIVHNGFKKFEIKNLPENSSLGDWILVDNSSNGLKISNSTQLNYPGKEWKRLQLSGNRSRMDGLRFRSKVIFKIREFFISKGLWEVETPILVRSPGVETHLTAIKAEEYFLSPSPEFQMKRLLAGGSGSIFQITKSFRGDEEGNHHNPEFTMLEWYSVGKDGEGLMREVEELISYLQKSIKVTSPLPNPPYKRITMAEAFLKYADIEDYYLNGDELFKKVKWDDKIYDDLTWEDAFFEIFVELVEPKLTEEGPCFLTEWPAPFASLAKLKENNPKVADRFEFFAKNLEIANGFAELIDGNVQKERSLKELEERKISHKPLYPMDEKFLESLLEGMPPASGIALGVDRLIMLLWGTNNIQDIMTFSNREL